MEETGATAKRIVLRLHPTALKVAELLGPHIEREGFDLVSVEYHKGTRSSMLRLLVDRPDGGISLDDLGNLSPVLSDLLDVYDPIEGRYMLEVASPGINRPLIRQSDFEAQVGMRVRIRTHHAVEGRKAFMGRLVMVDRDWIELDDESAKRRFKLNFDDMKGANYEHDFD